MIIIEPGQRIHDKASISNFHNYFLIVPTQLLSGDFTHGARYATPLKSLLRRYVGLPAADFVFFLFFFVQVSSNISYIENLLLYELKSVKSYNCNGEQ